MAYDEDIASRIRDSLARESDVTEKKMFGGLAFQLAKWVNTGTTYARSLPPKG